MVTIKAYTTIEQSRKLAEILPIESADMLFQVRADKYADSIRVPLTREHWEQMMPDINPCWSLAALLKIIGHYTLQTVSKDKKVFIVSEKNYPICSDSYSEPVDACYEMILKLHELNLL